MTDHNDQLNHGITLCALEDVSEETGKVVRLDNHPVAEVVLIRQQDQVHGYRNVCPHAGRSLSWGPDQLLFTPAGHLVCTAHGATFDVRQGLCLSGPCLGASLSRLNVAVVNQMIVLLPDDPEADTPVIDPRYQN